jgi:two-component system, LytTR family, sensor kinase
MDRFFEWRYLFWKVNILGWLIFCLIWFITNGPESVSLSIILDFALSNLIIPFFVTILLRYFYFKIRARAPGIFSIAFSVFFGSFIASIIWYFIDFFRVILFHNISFSELIPRLEIGNLTRVSLSMFILLLAWSTLYFMINSLIETERTRRDKDKAQMLAVEAKMEMLANQINPHFLFNSLNAVTSLIDIDHQKAKELVNELSEFLRLTLKNKGNIKIPLKNEIRMIDHFIQIQTLRFRDKLMVTYQIDPETRTIPVLPSILYPLVENAIKHGLRTSEPLLKVEISSKVDCDFLFISVINSGMWGEDNLNSPQSTNIGLANVRDRLLYEYGSMSELRVEHGKGSVAIVLRIPLDSKCGND